MSNTKNLIKRREAAVAKGVATRGIYAERAKNAELWTVDGDRFIDFAAGIAVNNTGHCHPKVMAAVASQAEAFTHTCFHVAPYKGYITLAERLNGLTPGDFDKKAMLVTTGAEAVENAVKMARAYTGRSGVIAFSGGFHGRTLMGMALCGKVNPYKKSFGAMPPEILHAPFPNEFHGVNVQDSLNVLENMLRSSIDPERVAAMIIEPVQGEGGFNIAQPEFLHALRKICDEHGIGGTYAGNPLAVAAANAVLDVIDEENLSARAEEIGNKIKTRLNSIAARSGNEAVGDVRGLGAMVAFELVTDRTTNAPDPALALAIVAEAETRGLIVLLCGTRGNAVRLLPPLTTPMAQVDEAMNILEASIEAAINSTAIAAE